jgi:formate-dependent phosphoribosylglycinamide formyltransferase (GAR transformylase)
MNVVFVAPFPAETTLRFLRALKALGHDRLLGVVHTPPGGEDAGLFDAVARIDNPLDVGEIADAVASLARRFGPVDRLLGILEPIQVELALVRERFGIPGPGVKTASLFRDKAAMKEALRAAGLPTARHALLRSWEDAGRFLDEVGFPIVLKPPAGMGCKGTWRIDDVAQARSALAALQPRAADPLLAEEFLTGEEHSLEAIVVNGEVRMTSTCAYRPTPLEVVENPWIQWVVVAPRELDGPGVAEAAALAARAIAALGLETGMTHMEWFRRPDGSLAIGEIAARPPGANIVRLTGLAHGTSLYRAWARAVVDEAFDGPFPREHAAGSAFLRGLGRGRVLAAQGLEDVLRELGDLVVEVKRPVGGMPKSDSYEGDGYVLVRHRETAVVEEALRRIVSRVRVRYAG